MSDYDGGFDERPYMSYTAQDALKAQGEIVRKSYENKIARLERELAAAHSAIARITSICRGWHE